MDASEAEELASALIRVSEIVHECQVDRTGIHGQDEGRGHMEVIAGLPNEARLSCGRNARQRKAVKRQRRRLAGEGTQFFPQVAPASFKRMLGSRPCTLGRLRSDLRVAGTSREKRAPRPAGPRRQSL